VPLPSGPTTLRVETRGGAGRRSSTVVTQVVGLPAAAAPRYRTAWNDAALSREIRRLAAGFGPTSSVYVQSLTTGAGAAWNAKASFPAASTLKLAIAVAALAETEGTPRPRSRLDALLQRMLIVSDDAAANDVERYLGGSTSGGSARVNALMRSLGLVDTEMYGGYLVEPRRLDAHRPPIPSRVESQPSWGVGKRTTAYDLAQLARAVWLASGNIGPLRRVAPGFTRSDARFLMYLLARVRDPGKLDREVRRQPGVTVLHKAGWINAARHDHGLVFWRGGVFVVAVMTHRSRGAGPSSDVLAGRVAAVTLRRLRSTAG
jgi:Beta-lactamase enzyme family